MIITYTDTILCSCAFGFEFVWKTEREKEILTAACCLLSLSLYSSNSCRFNSGGSFYNHTHTEIQTCNLSVCLQNLLFRLLIASSLFACAYLDTSACCFPPHLAFNTVRVLAQCARQKNIFKAELWHYQIPGAKGQSGDFTHLARANPHCRAS